MNTSWRIERIINFRTRRWVDGYAHLGFSDRAGAQYVVDYDHGWVGCLGANGRLRWSQGRTVLPEITFEA